MDKKIRRRSAAIAAAFITAVTAAAPCGQLQSSTKLPAYTASAAESAKIESAGGWNEMLYMVVSGLTSSEVTGVSFTGPTTGSFSPEDLAYLVRDTAQGLRVDIPGLSAGSYSVTLNTAKGDVTQSNISVTAQDRSGYAHFGFSEGVGAYTDSGELKKDAIVLYVTEENKDTVSVTSKDGTTVSGIGNTVDSSHGVSVLGSRNVVKMTDNIQLLGDNREVTSANGSVIKGSVIIGSADSKMTTSVTDATILGHNANVEKAGGVALGAGSVASREEGVAGYDPATKTDSTDSSATWKATDAAVSVGKEDGTMTRQITGVAAGTKATDAVNVAQLQKAMETVQASAETSDTDTHVKAGTYAVTTVKDATGKETQGVALDVVDKAGAPVGKVTITDVAKASDVGDVSKLATTSKTVVGAINDVNTKVDTVDKKVDKVDTKVGNLQYVAEGKAKVVANNDSVTTAIGKLDQAIGNASTEAGKHTVVSTEDANLTVKNIAKSGEAANYQLALSKDIKVDSVTTTKVTSDTVNTKNLSVSDAASIGDVTINKDGQGTVDGLKNTTWDAKNITSGRAATEDQVKAATKNAVNSFTRSWSKELGRYNVRVVGVAPGILEATGLRTLAYEEALSYTRGITVEDLRKGYKNTKTTPLGRSGKLTEVANLVLFLASDRASYIHGVTYNVAGGKTRG